MELPEIYEREIALPRDRYHLIDDGFDCRDIKLGVVFIFAQWSVSSLKSFRQLNKLLKALSLPNELKVYVADTDNQVSDQFFVFSEHVRGGNGEAFFVVEGKVWCQFNCLVDYTGILLNACLRVV
jgi:hypothetical protein